MSTRASSIVDAATFRRLSRARELIHDRHADAVSLDDMAGAAGLSRYHFLRLFRRVYGRTPHAYLADVRIARARDLLGRGTTVTEACLEVGFTSVSSFSALFARKTGASPSAYQRRVRRLVQVPARLPLLSIPWCLLARMHAAQF